MAKKVTIENIEQIFSLVKAESERLSKENENLKKIIEDNEKAVAAKISLMEEKINTTNGANTPFSVIDGELCIIYNAE